MRTVNGKTIGENVAATVSQDDKVIRQLSAEGGSRYVRKSGAGWPVIKVTAASAELLKHRGRAYSRDAGSDDGRIDRDICRWIGTAFCGDADCGPGVLRFPEWGHI